PRHMVARRGKMQRAERRLCTRLGREPTLAEIAEQAHLPLEQARQVSAAARVSASLDQPVGDDDTNLAEFVADDAPPPEVAVEVADRREAVSAVLRCLPERERQVLVLRL